ncbi:protein phosphatase CheZ [Roseospirillum parvum]|uniref:Chemotaxis regulator CheZ, phosphatase of CheY~P n=1 Tax=Roseospirillum parvum TaxID=83401 RepID=A0A1G7UEM1_9PROT|nr:protein phosphatase CheZ [Roseospirillum parvum]SDG45758.1 Chemotaxis regulator CheZ, phosphatase of CheY~P [Roseospirillum parvum]
MSISSHDDVHVLKRELLGLFQHIQKIRKEIAAIRRPGSTEDEDHFSRMSDELDAIVAATEGATNTIMENVEGIEDILTQVRAKTSDAEILALLDQVPEKSGNVFEACAFQDITGQRITKVVTSLQFIENRVNSLILIWGPDSIAQEDPPRDGEADKDEYKKYLHGPQLAGHGVSQDDVDAMLAGAAPPPEPKPEAAKAKVEVKKAEPAPAPKADEPAEKPAPKPAPAPAPQKAEEKADEGGGEAFSQDDIDKLFG